MSGSPPGSNGLGDQAFFHVVEGLTEPQRDIISDIISHPQGMPSMKELEFTTSLHHTTLRQHLNELIDANIIEAVEFPCDKRVKGQPSTFYRITDPAQQFFEQNSVWSQEHLQELYARVDKPPEILKAEAADRPAQ